MPGSVTTYKIGIFEGWAFWQRDAVDPVDVAAIAAEAADGPEAQAVAAIAIQELEAECRTGVIYVAGLWVPDRTTGRAVASARLELRTGPADRDVSRDEGLRIASGPFSEPGFTVRDRGVSAFEVPAGPAVGEVTQLSSSARGVFRRVPGFEEVRVVVTVYPAGSSDVVCIDLRTRDVSLVDELCDSARGFADSLVLQVGPIEP